jgi:hypothetical protein
VESERSQEWKSQDAIGGRNPFAANQEPTPKSKKLATIQALKINADPIQILGLIPVDAERMSKGPTNGRGYNHDHDGSGKERPQASVGSGLLHVVVIVLGSE